MKTFMGSVLAASVALILPFSAIAWVDYGAYYYTPGPHSQMYYQPMRAYSYAPAQSWQQNTYISYPQQNYTYGQGAPQYGSYPQYSYPSTRYPQYGSSSQWGPSGYGYPTGDTAPWIGGQLCNFPDYNGRALCGSNPNQWIYDPWTGSWY